MFESLLKNVKPWQLLGIRVATITGASGIVQNLRLPGQEWDLESTFNHNGFRDYAATLTRYVQTDPIGLAGGMNTYQYAKGNPFKNVDRTGLNSDNSPIASPIIPIPPNDRDIPLSPVTEQSPQICSPTRQVQIDFGKISNITGTLGTGQDILEQLGIIRKDIPMLAFLDISSNYLAYKQNPNPETLRALTDSVASLDPAVSLGQTAVRVTKFAVNNILLPKKAY